MSDWLFDGTPPAELRGLRAFRHDAPRRPTAVAWGAAAAAVGMALFAIPRGPAPWSTQTASCAGCTWAEGALLDTTTAATARLDDRGELRARARTVVRRLEGEGAHLALEQGTVDVLVDAPADWLRIQLPGVELVDLGCAFRASVDPEGHGVVAVGSGAVALRGTGPETVLPAGTMAATWPDGHAGLAVSVDADDAFVSLVDAADRGGPMAPVLAAATLDDAITVWHLLDRADDRRVVVDRLEALLGADHVDREGLLSDDDQAEEAALAYVIGRTL